jgi:hypothetical protein
MSEEPDPFAAFKEGQPPAQADPPAAGKKKKIARKRNGKVTKTVKTIQPSSSGYKKSDKVTLTVKAVVPKEKKPRKKRQAKELRLPISTLLEIGSLSDEESGALLSIGAGLQKLPKRSRQKITVALSKIFS